MGEITDGFEEAKAWYQSKTIIGVIITAVGMLISTFFPESGIDLDGAVTVIMEDGEKIAEQSDLTYGSLIAVWGLLQALWGRVAAKLGIKSVVSA